MNIFQKSNPELKINITTELSHKSLIWLRLNVICTNTSQDVLLNVFHAALLCLLSVLGVVDVGFVLFVVLNVFQMDDHVQRVCQDEQQDEGGDEAHEDGRRQESSTVTCRRKFSSSDVEGLNLERGERFLAFKDWVGE